MKTVAAIIALAAVAIASPVLESRGTVTVTLCNEQDLASCGDYSFDSGSCWNFPADKNDVVSSLDTHGAQCTFYADGSCTGGSWATSGTQNTVPANLNDALSSARC